MLKIQKLVLLLLMVLLCSCTTPKHDYIYTGDYKNGDVYITNVNMFIYQVTDYYYILSLKGSYKNSDDFCYFHPFENYAETKVLGTVSKNTKIKIKEIQGLRYYNWFVGETFAFVPFAVIESGPFKGKKIDVLETQKLTREPLNRDKLIVTISFPRVDNKFLTKVRGAN